MAGEAEIMRAIGKLEGVTHGIGIKLDEHRVEVQDNFGRVYERLDGHASQIGSILHSDAEKKGGQDERRLMSRRCLTVVSGSLGAAAIALLGWVIQSINPLITNP